MDINSSYKNKMTSYTTKTTTLAKDCLNSRQEDGVRSSFHEMKIIKRKLPDRIIKSEGSSTLEVCKTINSSSVEKPKESNLSKLSNKFSVKSSHIRASAPAGEQKKRDPPSPLRLEKHGSRRRVFLYKPSKHVVSKGQADPTFEDSTAYS